MPEAGCSTRPKALMGFFHALNRVRCSRTQGFCDPGIPPISCLFVIKAEHDGHFADSYLQRATLSQPQPGINCRYPHFIDDE